MKSEALAPLARTLEAGTIECLTRREAIFSFLDAGKLAIQGVDGARWERIPLVVWEKNSTYFLSREKPQE